MHRITALTAHLSRSLTDHAVAALNHTSAHAAEEVGPPHAHDLSLHIPPSLSINTQSKDPVRQPMLDIARERMATSFSIRDMRVLLDGGDKLARARELAYLLIQRDPILSFTDGHPFDLTRKESREKTMAQVRRFVEIQRSLKDEDLKKAFFVAVCELSESLNMRLYVHEMLYRTSIELFGTEEQKAKLLPDVEKYNVIGSFAMTELGHSSSLRDLETTATLDLETDEWVIHSPSLTSTKWWIGMVGQTATHTVMVSQTVVNQKNIGLNWFILPLRDPQSGRLLPGITCGDIGAKAGRNGLDNGWIQVTQARIPRTNMLMKWCQVDKDGGVVEPPHPAVVYATLIPERLSVLPGIRSMCGQALTIAARYGVARRQGSTNQQIIDYQAQQVNIVPAVAGIYVLIFAEKKVMAYWRTCQTLASENPMEYMTSLPDIHAVSAGIKAATTWWGAFVLENCRRACGGHAYSAYNAIAGHIGDWGVMTTGGGDNFPMAQQCARYVLSCVQRGIKGKKNVGSAKFLQNAPAILNQKEFAFKSADFKKLETYVDLFSYLIVKMSVRISAKLAAVDKSRFDDVWNANMVELIQLSHIYTFRYIFTLFTETLKEVAANPATAGLVEPLHACGALFAGDVLRRDFLDVCLEEKVFGPQDVGSFRSGIFGMVGEVRKEVIGLTDAWGFPDFIVKAPIGRYDGDIYTSLFETVTRAPDCFHTPYFDAEIKPLLSSK
ncbi:fatty-acyl coenzyme A oxidase [Dinochytrium kinnereticum]|nr:fatty-acyl coenzyme A oxidase [Dinochytrium kinnereticum]